MMVIQLPMLLKNTIRDFNHWLWVIYSQAYVYPDICLFIIIIYTCLLYFVNLVRTYTVYLIHASHVDMNSDYIVVVYWGPCDWVVIMGEVVLSDPVIDSFTLSVVPILSDLLMPRQSINNDQDLNLYWSSSYPLFSVQWENWLMILTIEMISVVRLKLIQ